MRLHLRNHCIQTAGKEERRRIESALLELDESDERFSQLADDLELITRFLQESDFPRLRSDRPELSGGCDILVELARDAQAGKFALSVVGALSVDTE
jgi:hypothetical protein